MNITIATLSPSSAKMFQKGSIKFSTVNPSGTVKSCHTAGLDNTTVEGAIVPPNRVLNGHLKTCKKYFNHHFPANSVNSCNNANTNITIATHQC
jgi:hypothetical protein